MDKEQRIKEIQRFDLISAENHCEILKEENKLLRQTNIKLAIEKDRCLKVVELQRELLKQIKILLMKKETKLIDIKKCLGVK